MVMAVSVRSAKRALLLPMLVVACGSDPETAAPPTDRSDDLALRPDGPVDFGDVVLGDTARLTVEVENRGEQPVELAVRPSGGFDELLSFSLDERRIPPGGAVPLELSLSPVVPAEVAEELILTDGAAEEPRLVVSLVGTGVDPRPIQAEPASVDLGAILTEQEVRTTVRLDNAGALPRPLGLSPRSGVPRCGDSAVDVCVETDAFGADGPSSLDAGATAELVLVARAAAAGPVETTLVLSTCPAEACDVVVPVTYDARALGLVCEPSAQSFGAVPVGRSRTLELRCTHRTNGTTDLLGWGRQGDPTRSFTVEAGRMQSLSAGDSVGISVVFAPQAEGALSAQVRLLIDGREDLFVPLTGRGGGPQLAIAPRRLDFGSVSTLAPAKRRLRLENRGNELLDVEGFDVGAEALITVDGAPTEGIPPGETTEVEVLLQPLTGGTVTSSLTVRTNDQTADGTVELSAEGVDLPPCRAEIETTVDFGDVPVGRRLRQFVTVGNVGDSACLLTGVQGGDPASDLDLLDRSAGLGRLEAGAFARIPVELAPSTTGTVGARLELGLSDPIRPFVEVSLAGRGIEGTSLTIVPSSLDLGARAAGVCSRSRIVRLVNRGGTPLTLSAIDWSGPAPSGFTLTDGPSLPLTLLPTEATSFRVEDTATSAGGYQATIVVDGAQDGTSFQRRIPVETYLGASARTSESFRTGPRPTDVLMVVTTRLQAFFRRLNSFRNNVGDIVRVGDQLGIDYRFAVVSNDAAGLDGEVVSAPAGGPAVTDGPLDRRFVEPSSGGGTPSLVLTDNLRFQSFTSNPPAALRAAELALSPRQLADRNRGFLRRGARLAILLFQDEADASPGEPAEYVDAFLEVLGRHRRNEVRVVTVAAPQPAGLCQDNQGTARSDGRMHAVSDEVGGGSLSICDVNPNAIGRRLFDPVDAFVLSRVADPSTLRVFVDGVEVPERAPNGAPRWSYDPRTSELRYEERTLSGETLRVEYAATCR